MESGLGAHEEIMDALPNGITFVNKTSSSLYSDKMKRFMERFHDVIVRIRRWGGFLMGCNYWTGIDRNITFDIIPVMQGIRLEVENL